jgi:hypothetical protein
MLPRVSDCAFVLRLLPKQKNDKVDDACITPKILSVMFNYPETRKFRKLMYCNKMRGVSVFATNFVPKIFRPGKYLSCPDLLWCPSSLLLNGYLNKDKAARA